MTKTRFLDNKPKFTTRPSRLERLAAAVDLAFDAGLWFGASFAVCALAFVLFA